MSTNFHTLKVVNVKAETDQAVAVTLGIPADKKKAFEFIQGQYLTLKFNINGKEVRRAYSMCSSPLEENLSIGVKRVNKGLVSNHINDHIKVGSEIEVMEPQGNFYTKLAEENRKNYYLFGGGSGITPLLSIAKTLVEKEAQSSTFLLYANESEDTIMFKEELESIEKRYEGQFKMEHILNKPKLIKGGGLGGFFKKAKPQWTGKTGLVNAKIIGEFIEENQTTNKENEYFLCGPAPMMDIVEKALNERGIDPKKIHREHFTSLVSEEEKAANAAAATQGAKVTVTLEGQTIDVTINDGKTILDTLLDNDFDPPYSCTSGACSTCMAKSLKGK